VSKSAAAVLAIAGFLLFSIPMSAQFGGLLPNGNVFAGVSYGQLSNATNQQSYRGFEGSAEDLLFSRIPHLGVVVDASGYFRSGEKQYNFVGGLRFSSDIGKWRPFVHGMAGIREFDAKPLEQLLARQRQDAQQRVEHWCHSRLLRMAARLPRASAAAITASASVFGTITDQTSPARNTVCSKAT